jgi:RHS repeat-associated protein
VTTGPEWGLSFSYDGFGNLLNQQVTKGTAYGMSLAYDGLTNRISSGGYGYDANGNLTAMPYLGLTYDAQNRLTRAVHTVNGTEEYGYDPRNQRVWHKQANGEEYFYFYGPGGERLGRYRLRTYVYTTHFEYGWLEMCFGGRLVARGSQFTQTATGVTLDRLGSEGRYYPYGEARDGSSMFATYRRDATGLDYANQRYYSSTVARFLTPDPYQASGGAADPQSWNRYAYVQADPVNFSDATGLAREEPVNDWGMPLSWQIITQVVSDGETLIELPIIGFWQGARPSRRSRQLSNTEKAEQLLMPALSRAIQALTLNNDCMELFGDEETRTGKYNPVAVLTDLVMSNISGEQSSYGVLMWRAGTGANVTANGIPYLSQDRRQ